jgi:hypothetical protein
LRAKSERQPIALLERDPPEVDPIQGVHLLLPERDRRGSGDRPAAASESSARKRDNGNRRPANDPDPKPHR